MNEAIFNELVEHREQVEQAFGGTLEWRRLEGKQSCRISKTFDLGGYRDDEGSWPEIHDAMIEAMVRLEKAVGPHVAKL